MINKKLITKFKDIQSKILKLDKLYYQDSKSNISDGEYDTLKKKYNNLITNNKDLLKYDKLTVGFVPSEKFTKIRHRLPMLSLGNAFNKEDLEDFIIASLEFLKVYKSSTTHENFINLIRKLTLIYKDDVKK